MSDPDQRKRLEELESRIAKLRHKEPPKAHQEEHYSQAQQAWRMVIELVTGLMIGFGIGYGLDSLFGTIPIFLVLFTFLGLAAGVQTMMRSAAEMQKANMAEAAGDDTAPDAGDTTAPDTGDEERTKDGD
ncbi:AtpZ/AtpI family protein [Roseovarius sp. MMSF_3281]|uniref:AtpZ/AtpI family protein n=1 Tax=Roseovarius sp. MMSF_3281 TaxID=3046694 RepID=UPI00273F7316|nr:AtpZ/AtpI family protein [Roseovarius sp. MMSF_3281]